MMTQSCKPTQRGRRGRPATPRLAAARPGEIDSRLDAGLFRALSDPTRLSLLSCIAKCGRACSLGEVAECCRVDVSVVSRHLSLLARAGVLGQSRQGRSVYYTVNTTALCGVLRALADALEACCPGGCCEQGGPVNKSDSNRRPR